MNDFQLLMKPVSADCNQECRYCFYRRVGALYPSETQHRMSGETLEAVIRRYLGLRLPQSVFCWQGGEPTLAGLDFYRHAVRLMQRHGRDGQTVGNALQTNGLLLDEDWCRFLPEYRFLVGLSLDGPREIHDAYRGVNGGSYDEVLRAMARLRRHQVEFNVLAVVTGLAAPVREADLPAFSGDGHCPPAVHPLCRVGLRRTSGFVQRECGGIWGFLCELFDEWMAEESGRVSERLFDALLAREIHGHSGLCLLDGGCGNYFVVEYNGDAYPCDFFVAEEWRLGNVRKTPFEKLRERSRAREFRRARRRLPEECQACPWQALCQGGCLKDRQRASERLNVPTFFCKAYQRLFSHAAEPIRRRAAEIRAQSNPPKQFSEENELSFLDRYLEAT